MHSFIHSLMYNNLVHVQKVDNQQKVTPKRYWP